MRGRHPGFSFVELVVVLAIMGIVLSVSVPRLRMGTDQKWNHFVAELNAFLQEVRLRAIRTHTEHKIVFNMQKRTFRVQKFSDANDTQDQDQQEKYEKLVYAPSKILLPELFTLRQFFIRDEDQVALHGEHKELQNVWFFISSTGLAQSIIINVSNGEQENDKEEHFSLVLNPFYVQCKVYEEFQQPQPNLYA